ncbi:FkbM family methyltransferase [Mucilaginibacter sp.]|uniref:FkbM family methyltransferase n=1 Tax=Mucilaginibacter sp. TaxID=1882438 RepID=UPI0035BC2121
MRKLKTFVKKILFRFVQPPVMNVNNSNSQAGEDRVVEYLFSSMGISQISYIDIGANDPIDCNNTYYFYSKGNRGVLVEPDLDFTKRIQTARPADVVVNAAINDVGGREAELFVFDHPALNTLSKEEADTRIRSGLFKLIDTRKVILTTIEDIIINTLQGKLPHLVSLDVEGVDYKVLQAFDFLKYPVPVWIVETCAYSENHIKPKVTSIIDLMLSKGYFVFADTYINTIFVHKEWFNNYQSS